MTIHKFYRRELEAARRLFSMADRHPYVSNAILATVGVIFALYVFFFYPL